MTSILRKLDVSDRTEACVVAMKRNIIYLRVKGFEVFRDFVPVGRVLFFYGTFGPCPK